MVGGLMMAGVMSMMVTPWALRNYVALGGFVPFRSNLGLELAIGNNRWANGSTYGTSHDDPGNPIMAMHPYASGDELARLIAQGELEYMQEKQRTALHWMRVNPGKTVELTVRRFRLFWFPPVDVWSRSSPARRLKAVAFSIIGLLALVELLRLAVVRHDRAWLLMAAAVGPSLIYLVTHVDPRYRYPVFGITTVLAAHLLYTIGRNLSTHVPIIGARLDQRRDV